MYVVHFENIVNKARKSQIILTEELIMNFYSNAFVRNKTLLRSGAKPLNVPLWATIQSPTDKSALQGNTVLGEQSTSPQGALKDEYTYTEAMSRVKASEPPIPDFFTKNTFYESLSIEDKVDKAIGWMSVIIPIATSLIVAIGNGFAKITDAGTRRLYCNEYIESRRQSRLYYSGSSDEPDPDKRDDEEEYYNCQRRRYGYHGYHGR